MWRAAGADHQPGTARGAGEQVRALTGLALPRAGDTGPAAAGSDAVRLLADRGPPPVAGSRCTGTDLSGYTQAELDAVADELNDRPRETLSWLKPTEVLNKFLLDATGAPTS